MQYHCSSTLATHANLIFSTFVLCWCCQLHTLAFIVSVKWCLIKILISIPLTPDAVEHLQKAPIQILWFYIKDYNAFQITFYT